MAKKVQETKKLKLALQGGGAHGAFTWGVLDAFLEDGRVNIESISATSAGAMNAVALAYGLMSGSSKDARTVLHHIWQRTSEKGALYSPVKRMPWETFMPQWHIDENAWYMMFDMATRMLSPYQFNPLGLNPIREILNEVIDFDALGDNDKLHLYLSATCVETGKAEIFTGRAITDDVVMASASLPFLYQAVEIDGKHYWDGGYVGNPPLFPLVDERGDMDICLVQINPVVRNAVPRTSYDINNRMHEIAFNASLHSELRNLAIYQKMKQEGWINKDMIHKGANYRFHVIGGDDYLADLSVASKFSTEWEFLCSLKDTGYQAAKKWLDQHYDALGKEQTFHIGDEFL